MAKQAPVRLHNPPGLYDSSVFGYSHLGEVPAGRRLVFIAGQGGENEQGVHEPDFQAQVARALHNLKVAVEAAGGTVQDIVRLTVYIVDHTEAKLPVYGAELVKVFGDGPKPTATLIPVPRLALDSMLFEIDAIAAVPA